ncbi:hypothetical protein [Winogradskyella endarachnes]|uniref:Uncharacterized protein n=1 Tax=Winogradskyella endarachnes TaxID=2681965 RepID=A0A6L6U540_9FLAO|nr:hypothetical protein [Winogradskyella endarachnes]MUU77285.1 hypothetical protein [Winogradskyella endarachnes]
MNIFKTIDKVLAGFGNIKAMERNHVDTFTEDLIQNIKGTKLAESKLGQLFGSFQNLAGYEFLNVSILSTTNIKTLKGCELVFETDKRSILIPSDTKEIESDFSNVSNIWLTKVSFILNESEKNMIVNGSFKSVTLNFKKRSLKMFKV